VVDFYENKEKVTGTDLMRHIEKVLMLQTLDGLWKDHLLSMDHLREGIGLRGYAQKDPIVEYKREGFAMFEQMIDTFAEDVVQKLFRVQVEEKKVIPLETRRAQPMTMSRSFAMGGGGTGSISPPIANNPQVAAARGVNPPPTVTGTVHRQTPKVGRNDPCPCGSGKKYKKCHGA
jgi:preprotein translocase subunit SecA